MDFPRDFEPPFPFGPVLRVGCAVCGLHWIYESIEARWKGEETVRCPCGEFFVVKEFRFHSARDVVTLWIGLDPACQYVQSETLGRPMKIGELPGATSIR